MDRASCSPRQLQAVDDALVHMDTTEIFVSTVRTNLSDLSFFKLYFNCLKKEHFERLHDCNWFVDLLICFNHFCYLAHCILPCLHGGTCISPYLCACRLGYTGNRCQTGNQLLNTVMTSTARYFLGACCSFSFSLCVFKKAKFSYFSLIYCMTFNRFLRGIMAWNHLIFK